MELDEIEKALAEYEMAAHYYPENPELPYWSAITLVSNGQLDQALPIFRDVFHRAPKLRKLTPRLVDSGLLPDDKNVINQIMNVQ